MGYKVIAYFQDLQDEKYEYNVGDTFPRKGLKVSEERLAELSGKDNKRGIELIKKVAEPKKPAEKPVEKKPAKK